MLFAALSGAITTAKHRRHFFDDLLWGAGFLTLALLAWSVLALDLAFLLDGFTDFDVLEAFDVFEDLDDCLAGDLISRLEWLTWASAALFDSSPSSATASGGKSGTGKPGAAG